jgi:hypothetical protein
MSEPKISHTIVIITSTITLEFRLLKIDNPKLR